jgi:hypothetical protein
MMKCPMLFRASPNNMVVGGRGGCGKGKYKNEASPRRSGKRMNDDVSTMTGHSRQETGDQDKQQGRISLLSLWCSKSLGLQVPPT